ncbi:hypothetical protein Hanom_Chr10g00960111 [Helianthus anomalus]
MLEIVLEINPTWWQFFNHCRNLECLAEDHSFRMNIMKNNLQFLDLAHDSFSIYHFKVQELSHHEFLSARIFCFVFAIQRLP